MINHIGNKGSGEAVKTILRYAIENLEDDDVLITMEADNTMIIHQDSGLIESRGNKRRPE